MTIRYDMLRTEQALGPGKRVILWTHGCPRSCPGCIAAETNRLPPRFELSASTLANRILQDEDAEGITLSGGEPFAQAEALTSMLRQVQTERISRGKRPFGVIIFTGYRVGQLSSLPGGEELLSLCDAVIDGEYREEEDAGEGWRGSTNQRLILRTERYSEKDFTCLTRTDRIRVEATDGIIVGLPAKETVSVWRKITQQEKSDGAQREVSDRGDR